MKDEKPIMRTIFLFFNEICLQIICDRIYEAGIRGFFCSEIVVNHFITPSFTLIITEKVVNHSGIYARLVNDFFHGATMSCWIDNKKRICWISDFSAESQDDINWSIQYFCSNMFNRLLEMNGYLGIHSSCVVFNNVGVAFIGDRMAGKTTCMLNLIDAGFDLVCNDVLAMKYISEIKSMYAYGVPNDVYVRITPCFCKQHYFYKYQPLIESQEIIMNKETSMNNNRFKLSHKDLAKINKVEWKSSARINLVVIPKYNPSIDTLTFFKLDKQYVFEHVFLQETELIHDSTLFLYQMKTSKMYKSNICEISFNMLNIQCYICEYNERTTAEFVSKIKNICETVCKL